MPTPETGPSISPRELRHDAVDDLEAFTFNLKRESNPFTQAEEAGQHAQTASDQHDKSTLPANRNPPLEPKPLDHPSLSTRDMNSSTTVLIHQIPHQDNELKRRREQQQKYAQHMAEAALTRNGRALKAKPTTKVAPTTVHSYTSAYTRPCAELWREVVERRYPPGAG
ncbi:hypothetical protein KC349_g788 [Hortaea werneckii]|nr:hypothetical protein KC349_g788 [Hortaea werneckii]